MIDLTQIIVAIIGLCATIISAYLVPHIKAKTNLEQRQTALMWATIAVQAAEMIYKAGNGPQKYEYAKQFIKSKGFDFSDYEIKALIESAVLQLKGQLLEIPAPAESVTPGE